MHTIGVFDSGKGGQSVANAIMSVFPEDTILFREDSDNLPYGSKSPAELLELVVPILQDMVGKGCDVIVIACNTVTTTLIGQLRGVITVPLIGIEPMVKPAAELTKTGVIAICATPTTLKSDRYHQLKSQYAQNVTILEPDCSDWASMIEDKAVDAEKIQQRISYVLNEGADVIVLACTHYHWIEDDIKELAKSRARVLQPEPAIMRQLGRVLSNLDL